MKRRTASDRRAKCIIEMLHEYKKRVEKLEYQIISLKESIEVLKKRREEAVIQADKAMDTIGEIAEIIAGITEQTEGGHIRIYLSNITPEDGIELNRLFRLLDIPMTAEQIKEGDNNVED